MLERQQGQLVAAIQELYRRTTEGEGWSGDPLKLDGDGRPLTHDILERLGFLKQDDQTDSPPPPFEENLVVAQQRLFASGAGSMQRQDSSDASSPTSDGSQTQPHILQGLVAHEPYANHGFAQAQLPPTPPNQQGAYRAPMPQHSRRPSTQLRTMSHPGYPAQPQLQPQFIPQNHPQQMYPSLHRQRHQQLQVQPPGQTFFPQPVAPTHMSDCDIRPGNLALQHGDSDNNDHMDYLQLDTSAAAAAAATTANVNPGLGQSSDSSWSERNDSWNDSYFGQVINPDPPMMP